MSPCFGITYLNDIKKLERKVSLEIMAFSFIKNYSTNLPQL